MNFQCRTSLLKQVEGFLGTLSYRIQRPLKNFEYRNVLKNNYINVNGFSYERKNNLLHILQLGLKL